MGFTIFLGQLFLRIKLFLILIFLKSNNLQLWVVFKIISLWEPFKSSSLNVFGDVINKLCRFQVHRSTTSSTHHPVIRHPSQVSVPPLTPSLPSSTSPHPFPLVVTMLSSVSVIVFLNPLTLFTQLFYPSPPTAVSLCFALWVCFYFVP